jgi:hypothetical protein
MNFNSACSLKYQFADRHVAPLKHIILISYSLKLYAQLKSNKYQIYSLCFEWFECNVLCILSLSLCVCVCVCVLI